MADNINVTPGAGSTVAADDIGGILHQRVKMVIGADGVNDGDISASNPMPVSLDSASLAALENISVTVTTSAEVEVKNDSGNPIPVNGTVTANAGTNLNTSLLALDSTVAKDSSLTTIDNSVNTLLKPASTLSAVTTVGGITNTVTVKADTPVNQINAFKVDGSAVTQPVSAITLPLPSGAATETTLSALNAKVSSVNTGAVTISSALPTGTNSIGQVTANAGTNLNTSALNLEATQSAINGKLNSLGQKTMVNSMPVVIASDQTAIPASQSGTWNINNVSGTVSLPTGAATSANQTTANGSLSSIDTKTPALGQALAAASTPVVLTAAQITTLTPPTSVFAKNQDGAGNNIASVDDGNSGKALEVAQAATSFVFSTVNSTTTQLTAGATFTGSVEVVTNQQSASVLVTTDQPGTLIFIEYIDAGGTKVSRTTTVLVSAGIPFSRSFVINGNYFKTTFQNTGASTTTTLNVNTAYGTIPSATALGNGQVSLDEVNGTAFTLGRKSAALSLPVVQPLPTVTYSASVGSVVMALLPTDVFTITGSATKTIKIYKVIASGSQNTAALRDIFLVKRSTANSGGVSTTLNNVANDSSNSSATAVVRAYTANPTLGTLVGNVRTRSWPLLGNSPGNNGQFGPDNTIIFDFESKEAQPITLRGTNEVLAVNFNSITSAGSSMHFTITWTEE